LNDSIQSTDQKIQKVTLTNNNVGLDPLKYLSRTINESADKAVKWFIILLISIFDPMAIMLLMAFNQMNLDKQEPSGIANEKEPLLDRIKKKFKKKMVVSEPVVEPELISEPILEVILEPIEPEVVIPVIPEPVTPELKFEPVQFKIPFDNEDEPYEKTEDDIDFFLDIEKENEVEEKKTPVGYDFSKNLEENENYEEILEPLSFIEPDVLIHHDIFGKGIILEVYSNQRVKVQFESGEIKELNTDYANLKQIVKIRKDSKIVEPSTDLYFQEKEIDGKTILEFTTKNVEYESEQPYIILKVDDVVNDIQEEKESVFIEEPVIEDFVEEYPEEKIEFTKTEDDVVTFGNQSISYGHRITTDEIIPPKIHFTKDRKGRVI
jgi:hypothetical protein